MKVRSIYLSKLLIAITIVSAGLQVEAIGITEGNYRLDINAYFDTDFNWMEKMPMAKNCTATDKCTMNGMELVDGVMLMDMPDSLFVDQNHLNLVFSGKAERTLMRLNFESRHGYSSFDGASGSSANQGSMGQSGALGSFRIAEVYGDYQFNRAFHLRVGSFFVPFGLYNQVRYITPLFASVVLPFLYELPPNYSGSPIFPSNGNLMAHGDFYATRGIEINYALYLSGGERSLNSSSMTNAGFGKEASNNKGLGMRLQTTFRENYALGLSAFTVEEDEQERLETLGADLDLSLPLDLHLQAEYATLQGGEVEKKTYYGRLIYEGALTWKPYVMFDSFTDMNDPLYKFTQNRLGVGSEFRLNDYTTLKTEYHQHYFSDTPTATGSTAMGMSMKSEGVRENQMIRVSTIFLL